MPSEPIERALYILYKNESCNITINIKDGSARIFKYANRENIKAKADIPIGSIKKKFSPMVKYKTIE
jgi:hypothetical protein